MPEIMRTSLTKIVLDSKILDNNTRALDFMGQLLTPPNETTITSVSIDMIVLHHKVGMWLEYKFYSGHVLNRNK